MRMPNGFGTVYKKRGRLRRPWYAQKTVGYDDAGRQIVKTVGTYETKAEALAALATYNGHPYDLDAARYTFAEMWEMYDGTVRGSSTRHNEQVAFRLLREFHSRRFVEILSAEWERAVNELPTSTQTKGRCRLLLRALYKMAVKNGIIDEDRSQFVIHGGDDEKTAPRTPFSPDEIMMLWEHAGEPGADYLLILIYSGVRISELLNLGPADVNLEQQFFVVREAKTKAGERVVPIADVVLPCWQRLYRSDGIAAFTSAFGYRWRYDNIVKQIFKPFMASVGMTHTIHETRHTAVSVLKSAAVSDTVLKKIIGHKMGDTVTESVYTHLPLPVLLEAVNLMHPTIEKYQGKVLLVTEL